MSEKSPETGSGRSESSLSGHSWPVVPLAVALLLLRSAGERGWAFWTAAALGTFGLVMAVIGVAECVKAVRRGVPPARAVGVVVALVVVGASFVWTLVA
ncbi:hypothetical protein JNUCC64_03400 [Streptomyces sp. JNUCC 64]